MNYRQYYESYYNIKLGKDLDVHHIDGNHENNNITNLVALPRKLHQDYHRILQALHCEETKLNIDLSLHSNLGTRYKLDLLNELCEILNKIRPYLNRKEFLEVIRA